ncbi:hypothetical protein GK047_01710 [Paenibacillus sp. SYP-B3998]|uniref:DUF5667 domain-containing protein n=1 Tax=Paenibacillus sp. SYP-B3998 TaxID=2678564 RepID=A0A6G3ZRA3_9BACL|nr:hypothetical protein [Paenibacillus sp. SYP-B3998]
MKVNKSKHYVSKLLSAMVLAALISPVLPAKQVEAASVNIQNNAPIIIINGSTINLGSFFEQIFNFEKWNNNNNGNSNKPDQGKPGKDKPEQGKPDKDKPEQGKPDKDKPEQGKPDKDKPDKDKPDKDKPDMDKPDKDKPDKDKPDKDKPDKDKPDKDKPDKDKPDKDSKKEYEAITKEATSQLRNLRNESKFELMDIAIQAKNTKNAKERSKMYEKGQAIFKEKESQFNEIINNVRSKLETKGFSTEIINEYNAEFTKEVELGKSLLSNLVK